MVGAASVRGAVQAARAVVAVLRVEQEAAVTMATAAPAEAAVARVKVAAAREA
jgi:hypothetical protein